MLSMERKPEIKGNADMMSLTGDSMTWAGYIG